MISSHFCVCQIPQSPRRQSNPSIMPVPVGPAAFPSALNADIALDEVKMMKVTIPGSPTAARHRAGSVSSDKGQPRSPSLRHRSGSLAAENGNKMADLSRTSSSSSTSSAGMQLSKSLGADILRPKKFQRVNKADLDDHVVAVDDFVAQSTEELSFHKGDKITGKPAHASRQLTTIGNVHYIIVLQVHALVNVVVINSHVILYAFTATKVTCLLRYVCICVPLHFSDELRKRWLVGRSVLWTNGLVPQSTCYQPEDDKWT